MAWINRLKQLLLGFLSADNKYIVTHDGKKIAVINRSFVNRTKATTSF
jgi:hypothetical protein